MAIKSSRKLTFVIFKIEKPSQLRLSSLYFLKTDFVYITILLISHCVSNNFLCLILELKRIRR